MNDRIREEGDSRLENIKSGEEERSALCRAVCNSRTRLSLPFSLRLSCARCDIPCSIILLAKACLSLLISVSRAKTLSSWSSFEDLVYCAAVKVVDSLQRAYRQHTVG